MSVRFHPAAESEAAVARDAFAAQDSESPRRFARRLDLALNRLQAFPEMGKPGMRGTRSVYLAPFPFHLVYLADNSEIIVVAIAHAARRPGYWRERSRRS